MHTEVVHYEIHRKVYEKLRVAEKEIISLVELRRKKKVPYFSFQVLEGNFFLSPSLCP